MENLNELKIETLIYLRDFFLKKLSECYNHQFSEILGISIIQGKHNDIARYEVMIFAIETQLETRIESLVN